MADSPKLDSTSSCEASGFEENKNNKVSILDHVNGYQYNAIKKSDSFVIDMDTFSGPINKDHINANSRITRSLSRKGSQRGGAAAASAAAAAAAEKKINSNINDRDTIVSTSSPRGHGMAPEKQTMAAAVVGADQSGGERAQGLHHHQITITTGNMISRSGSPENRSAMKMRNSFKRSSSTWVIDPKRVLLFFATLSSMGTILLIYFTIAVGKYRAPDESFLD